MNLKQLQYFLSIVETGSVTHSADLLHLSQPALTRAIRNLEEELGVELFIRLPRAMQLTRFGEAFARHARAVFVQLENAESELKYLSNRSDEEVAIGAGPTWLMGRLPLLTGQLLTQFPNAGIRVRGGHDQQLRDLLRAGEIDFALTEISKNPENSDFYQEPLVRARYVVACNRDHPLAQDKAIPLEKLLHYPWALPDLAVSAHERLAGIFHTRGLPTPGQLIRSTSPNFIAGVLETSHSLAFLVESSLGPTPPQHVVFLDLESTLPIREAGIVLRPDSWQSPIVEEFIEQLRADCREHPWQ